MAEPPLCLPLHLQQGKPARLHAFTRATCLNYGCRGMGHALRDAELEAACLQLGPRLLDLDLGGAFQLSSGCVARALRACPALRSLAADGSTLQDDAFAFTAEGPHAGPMMASGSQGAAEAGRSPAPAPAPGLGDFPAPLQRLEALSLRSCLFLRGGLLGSLAAACPSLTSLDLADCGLALK